MSTEQLFRLPLGTWVNSFVHWLTTTLSGLFAVIGGVLDWLFEVLDAALTAPGVLIIGVLLVLAAFFAKGWTLAFGTLIGLVFIYSVDQWTNAMDTLALVLVASLIAVLIGIPAGLWAAQNDKVSTAIRPVLDFLQTMPAFVYLIPAVVLFRVGVVPGIVATVLFSIAPGVRFTELGIRQVDGEMVEAGSAFGASPSRILRQIQIPLALPTIMAGINQVIMLALSMVVIAGMVGAPGLGKDVVASLQRVNVGLGFEAGMAVVILAMFLDRVTAALGDRSPVARALRKRTADA